jgi:AAA family ATP:ADP antiporter
VIDILAYRGSDALMGWFFTGLTSFGLGLGAIAAVGAGMAAVWSFVGIYLGKWFERESFETKGSTL